MYCSSELLSLTVVMPFSGFSAEKEYGGNL